MASHALNTFPTKRGAVKPSLHAVTTIHAGDKSYVSLKNRLMTYLSYEKTGWRRMPSIHFLRQEGVLSNPHACCSYYSCRRQILVLLFSMLHAKAIHACLVYVHTTLVCNCSVLFCSVCSEDYIEAGIARHGTALPFT